MAKQVKQRVSKEGTRTLRARTKGGENSNNEVKTSVQTKRKLDERFNKRSNRMWISKDLGEPATSCMAVAKSMRGGSTPRVSEQRAKRSALSELCEDNDVRS